jgi:hypothetical protein
MGDMLIFMVSVLLLMIALFLASPFLIALLFIIEGLANWLLRYKE